MWADIFRAAFLGQRLQWFPFFLYFLQHFFFVANSMIGNWMKVGEKVEMIFITVSIFGKCKVYLDLIQINTIFPFSFSWTFLVFSCFIPLYAEAIFTTVHFLDERAEKREQRQISLGIDEFSVIF